MPEETEVLKQLLVFAISCEEKKALLEFYHPLLKTAQVATGPSPKGPITLGAEPEPALELCSCCSHHTMLHTKADGGRTKGKCQHYDRELGEPEVRSRAGEEVWQVFTQVPPSGTPCCWLRGLLPPGISEATGDGRNPCQASIPQGCPVAMERLG